MPGRSTSSPEQAQLPRTPCLSLGAMASFRHLGPSHAYHLVQKAPSPLAGTCFRHLSAPAVGCAFLFLACAAAALFWLEPAFLQTRGAQAQAQLGGAGVALSPASGAAGGSVISEASLDVSAVDVRLNGIREIILEREVVWQIPMEVPRESLKGVAFFAHGCNHKAPHWFPPSSSCAHCLGLPEDQALVKAALGRGYAVIAISSWENCWQARIPVDTAPEITDVKEVMENWTQAHALQHLPMVALAASSGGYFISALALALEFQALVIVIASGIEEAFASANAYPPTLFVHMPKDSSTAIHVLQNMKLLAGKGIPTCSYECREMALQDHFLSDRIGGMDALQSSRIVSALADAKLLDEDKHLVPAYRGVWEEVVREKKLVSDAELLAKIEEELALAFAWHEMTSEYAEECVDFFQGVQVQRHVRTHAPEGEVTRGRCKASAAAAAQGAP